MAIYFSEEGRIMQYLNIFSTRKMVWFLCLSLSISSSSFLFADGGDEMIQELTQSCESLAKDMMRTNKKFPQSIENIEGLVTWHAALCGERPKGEGMVTNLCDGHLTTGGDIFFWQHKTKAGKLRNGFLTCE
jgi:hypothetical protein